jgi:phenylacetate-CoA ligase
MGAAPGAIGGATWSYFKLNVYRQRLHRRWRAASQETLRNDQWRACRSMLLHAWDNVPYYRERFEAAGVNPYGVKEREAFHRIPLLTKDDIRQAFPDRIVDRRVPFKPYMVDRTSGTTGQSLHYITYPYWKRHILFYLLTLGYRPREGRVGILTSQQCSANTCSLTRELSPSEVARAIAGRLPGFAHLDPTVVLTPSTRIVTETDGYFRRLYDEFHEHRPPVLRGDPVYFAAFARFLKREGLSIPPVRFIVCGQELLTPSVRALLEEVFACPVYTQYGCSEVADIASQCDAGRVHVRMDLVLLEVLRDDNTPAAPGELGRVVLTDLCNTVMPLIRYDLGDVARLADGPCPCGLNTVSLVGIEGRRRDVIQSVDGTAVTPYEADAIFRDVPGIDAYRLVQRKNGSYRISLLSPDGLPAEARDRVTANARRLLGAEARLRVREVRQMPAEGSNKYRFVYPEEK